MENLWVWLVVLAVLAVAFGPIFHLMPSRKDRRLAILRAAARRQGLSVELRPVPKLGADMPERVTAGGRIRTPMHPSVRYALPLALEPPKPPPAEVDFPASEADAAAAQGDAAAQPFQQAPATQSWRLLHGPAGWTADADVPPPSALATQLLPLLDRLPDDAVAVDRQGRSLGCCWLERFPAQAGTVTELKAALTEVAKAVAAWEAEAFNRS